MKQMLVGHPDGPGAVPAHLQPGAVDQLARALFRYAPITGDLLFSMHPSLAWGRGTVAECLVRGSMHTDLAALTATCGSFLFISQAWSATARRLLLRHARRRRAVRFWASCMRSTSLSTAAIAGIVSILGLVPALMGIPGSIRKARQADPSAPACWLAWLVTSAYSHRHRRDPRLGAGELLDAALVPVRRDAGHASLHAGAGPARKALRVEALDASRERDAMRSLAHTDPYRPACPTAGSTALASALSRCSSEKCSRCTWWIWMDSNPSTTSTAMTWATSCSWVTRRLQAMCAK